MDLALVIDKLVPGADYRRADDRAALAATWVDPRPIPSEAEIDAAWTELQADRDAKATTDALRDQRKTEAFTALQTSLAKRLQITITSPADLAGKADEVESKVAAKRAKAGAPTARDALFEEQLDMIFQLVVLMYRNA